MFKTQQELKDFLLWARSQRIKAVKVSKSTVDVEFSELAFIDEIHSASEMPTPPSTGIKEEASSSKTLADTLSSAEVENDEDLYWSTGN